jgi:hypothetical protein
MELTSTEVIPESSSFPIEFTPETNLASILRLFADVSGMVAKFKVELAQKLIPGLNKPGYEEERYL